MFINCYCTAIRELLKFKAKHCSVQLLCSKLPPEKKISEMSPNERCPFRGLPLRVLWLKPSVPTWLGAFWDVTRSRRQTKWQGSDGEPDACSSRDLRLRHNFKPSSSKGDWLLVLLIAVMRRCGHDPDKQQLCDHLGGKKNEEKKNKKPQLDIHPWSQYHHSPIKPHFTGWEEDKRRPQAALSAENQ